MILSSILSFVLSQKSLTFVSSFASMNKRMFSYNELLYNKSCIINPKITSKNIKNISNIKPQLKEVIENMHTDQTCKHFFQNNRRFSSLCNAILFSGEEVIKRDSLISYQNEETAIINQKMGITD